MTLLVTISREPFSIVSKQLTKTLSMEHGKCEGEEKKKCAVKLNETCVSKKKIACTCRQHTNNNRYFENPRPYCILLFKSSSQTLTLFKYILFLHTVCWRIWCCRLQVPTLFFYAAPSLQYLSDVFHSFSNYIIILIALLCSMQYCRHNCFCVLHSANFHVIVLNLREIHFYIANIWYNMTHETLSIFFFYFSFMNIQFNNFQTN